MSVEQDGFATEGFKPFPNLHADETLIHTYSELTDDALWQKAAYYTNFLEDSALMPHARQSAEHILNHLLFEMNYREQ